MNKKASFDTIVNLFRLLFVIVVFYSILFLIQAFIKQNIDVFEVESKILTHRLALSKELTGIDVDTSRLQVGIIDLEKFTSADFEKNLLNSIYYGKINSETSARFTLKDLDENKEYEAFYNKELYNEKKVLVEAKLIGAGAAKSLGTNYYILIRDKDKLKKGVLNIDVILPNR